MPRVVVAAASSSAGKTTIATGLMAALRARGLAVAGYKVGPDFIDPGYHALATGRSGRNLDAVLLGEHRVAGVFLHGAEGADLAVIEGVMGLLDGQLGTGGFGSTAHIAELLAAPVILVVDAAGSSRTAAAAALGLREVVPEIRLAGVILNRVASPRHAAELSSVLDGGGLAVLGVVPRSAKVQAPSRHLGLVPAAEREESAAILTALAEHVGEHVDLDAVMALAAGAGGLEAVAWDPASEVRRVEGRPTVAVMGGRAFTFRYQENVELLAAAGCRVVEVDPLVDQTLPEGVAGLLIGGGFPEIHVSELSANASLRAAIAASVAAGMPTVAECAGQLYLSGQLDGHPMVGSLDASARMTPRLSLGYRSASAPGDTLLAAAGEIVTGHEFHRTRTEPGAGATPAWSWGEVQDGFSADPAGTGRPTLHSSYLHLNWAGHPGCAQRFAEAAARFASLGSAIPSAEVSLADGIDLAHHGDRDLGPGLIDLAVNVRPGPPGWLAELLRETVGGLSAYPDVTAARTAIAARHRLPPEMVLPTAGAAEGFALIARTLRASRPVVVHPQFTEPEAALRAAGHAVQRWLLPVRTGAPTPSLTGIPDWADAVFVGNPTNPTGWVHQAADLLALGRERLLVVDEAFMDATGEDQSLIAAEMSGRLVLRSLSKTWGLAGLRVGYVVGDPDLIADLERAQPAWPVSAVAIAAMVATATETAIAEAAADYRRLGEDRAHLVSALSGAGFAVVNGEAPFVLVDTSRCGADSVRPALAGLSFAVRRGETFPGLGPHWIRVRVPAPEVSDRFVAALATLALNPG